MKILPSPLEIWFRAHEEGSRHHLGATMMSSFALKDLNRLFGIALPSETVLGYSPVHGPEGLKDTILRPYSFGGPLPVGSDQVLLTHGAIEGNFLALYALIEPGDEVVIQWPIYPQMIEVSRMLKGSVKPWKMEFDGGWRANLEKLQELITPKTKLIIINSPNNPTGYSFSEDELKEIVRLADSAGAFILSDEVYQGILPGEPNKPLAFGYPKAVSVNSLSKAFSLPGLRLGWMIAQDRRLIEKALELKEHMTICDNAISLALAETVLAKKELIWKENQKLAARNYEFYLRWKETHKAHIRDETPLCAVSAFPQLLVESNGLALNLRQEKNLFLVPGSLWGYPRHLRLSFGHRREKELAAALSILGEYLLNYSE